MKNKSNMFALILASFLVLGACSNTTNNTPAAPEKSAESSEPADPFGRYEEPVQISISIEIDPTDNELPPGDTPLDNQYTRQIKEA
ncbi:hypothetical protein P0100_24640, partial [Yersinia pestis]|nr:hypothetical protein [Yersinia pestis]